MQVKRSIDIMEKVRFGTSSIYKVIIRYFISKS